MAMMKIKRMPSPADLEQLGIEPEEFLSAFHENAIGEMSATVTLDANGVVTISGWQFQNDPSADWYTITP